MIPAISGAINALGAGGVGSVGTLGGQANVSAGTNAASPGGFSGALSSAMNSLEATQANATSAAQGLATGTISDPTTAITAVENASLAMDLASQIRDKLTDATNTIFQTQM
jgi:flagellar hook-basal body complex protein FliE